MRLNKHIADTGYCSRREADRLIAEKRVTASKSLAIDKERTSLTTLIATLFMISLRKKSPGSPPRANVAPFDKLRRALRELVRKSEKPVVLFVDEAHDLHFKMLRGLKRLCDGV
jgi:type II secretory pathway predicted ATPase ExeA